MIYTRCLDAIKIRRYLLRTYRLLYSLLKELEMKPVKFLIMEVLINGKQLVSLTTKMVYSTLKMVINQLFKSISSYCKLIDSNKRKSSIITNTRELQSTLLSIPKLILRQMHTQTEEGQRSLVEPVKIHILLMFCFIHITHRQKQIKSIRSKNN